MTHSLNPHLIFEAEAPGRLDRVLAHQCPDISRARFQRLIADGNVSVDGRVQTDVAMKVLLGAALCVQVPQATAPEPEGEAIALDILYEDKDLLVLNKPAGLVVHPGAGHGTGTLVNALIAHCGDSLSGIGGVKRPGIVHRLDKDTSGLLVVAKNDKAHHSLSKQFAAHGRDGRLHRSYLAVIWGALDRASGRVETGIARSTTNRQKMAVSNAANAKEAITHYQVLEQLGATSLIRCDLETGRTHQIRVHMAHLKHPLLGDAVYGQGFKTSSRNLSDKAQSALLALNRQALHAETLGFDHPRTGKALLFKAQPPADMTDLLSALRH